MPRRPRPRSRAPPTNRADDIYQLVVSDQDEAQLDLQGHPDDDDALTDSDVEDDDENDVDAPRIVQWADGEDDLEEDDQSSFDEPGIPGPSNLVSRKERILRQR